MVGRSPRTPAPWSVATSVPAARCNGANARIGPSAAGGSHRATQPRGESGGLPDCEAQAGSNPVPTKQLRPVHTFSIVARDPVTGELGVAVQSHWFSVGSIVPWAEAGVGAVATQSFVDPSYGKLGLELMRAGKSAPDALKSLLAGDEGREVRQVAMIDAQGRVDAWTGRNDIYAAGHIVGKDFSVQANSPLSLAITLFASPRRTITSSPQQAFCKTRKRF